MRNTISLPVHCKKCKKLMSVEGNSYGKVAVCYSDKCMKDKSYRRELLMDIILI